MTEPRQTVYRDGDRIRQTNGTGYNDRVRDNQILDHMERNDADPVFIAFAEAVLKIRAFERAAAAAVAAQPKAGTE